MGNMIRMALSFVLLSVMAAASFAADQADQVFAALKARNAWEVTRLLQGLALLGDFAQLDRVKVGDPGLFDARNFPGEFVGKIVFNYVEAAASAVKTAQKAEGKANPNPKGSVQWYIWDLDSALAAKAATKVASTQKALQSQIETDIKALSEALDTGRVDKKTAFVVSLYLFSINPADLADSVASEAEKLNVKFLRESESILEYLFEAGVSFPSTLPSSLKLEVWKRERTAFDAFVRITAPDTKKNNETKDGFAARASEAKRLEDLIMSTEITLPATLGLGTYPVEGGGYFPLTVSLPILVQKNGRGQELLDDQGRTILLLKVSDLGKADIRYYLDRASASSFTDKGFAAWTGTATIAAVKPGAYRLKELAVKNGKGPVTEGLWGFMVSRTRGEADETLITIDNYFKGHEYSFSGTRVAGAGTQIAITADGSYSLSSDATGPGELWKAELTARYDYYHIGDPGPAGGVVFYDKGAYSDGWRFLEAAPRDLSTGVSWNNGTFIRTDTAIGSGRSNTDAIFAAQGRVSYAATVCKNLSIDGYSDWFLPSKDALNLMYTSLRMVGRGAFSEGWYWSSSQAGSS
ncbi:MAG: hypothetical protein ACOYM2_21435, partial [Rectinemataceae bacterium]